MKFQDAQGNLSHPYLTSWGVTTRLVGAVIGCHGDERGLILPPKIAPIQVVIVPILRKDSKDAVVAHVTRLKTDLQAAGIAVQVDLDEQNSPGAKFYNWELKGVPLRIEVGPRDMEQGVVVVVSRLGKEKETVNTADLLHKIPLMLDIIQNELFLRAKARYAAMWHKIAKLQDFAEKLEKENGIYQTGWCQDVVCETKLKEHSATTRCVLESKEFTHCFACDKPSVSDVIVAKSY